MLWPETLLVAYLRSTTSSYMSQALVACVFAWLTGTIMQVTCKITNEAEKNRTTRWNRFEEIQLFDGIRFYINAYLGSNAEKFCLILDTLGDLTWVAAQSVTSPAWQNKNRLKAIEHVSLSSAKQFCFAEANVGRELGATSWKGGVTLAGLKIPQFQSAVILNFPDDVTLPGKADGVLGLSHSVPIEHVNDGFKTLLDALDEHGLITEKQFGIKICPEGRSMFTVGLPGDRYYTGHFKPIILTQPVYHWRFEVHRVKFGAQIIDKNKTSAFFVTSCDSIQGPRELVQKINEKLQCRFFEGRCYLDDTFFGVRPTIIIGTSSHQLALYTEQYVMEDSKGQAYSAFKPLEFGKDFWIIGAPAHFNRYIVYDKIQGQVDYANAICE